MLRWSDMLCKILNINLLYKRFNNASDPDLTHC